MFIESYFCHQLMQGNRSTNNPIKECMMGNHLHFSSLLVCDCDFSEKHAKWPLFLQKKIWQWIAFDLLCLQLFSFEWYFWFLNHSICILVFSIFVFVFLIGKMSGSNQQSHSCNNEHLQTAMQQSLVTHLDSSARV